MPSAPTECEILFIRAPPGVKIDWKSVASWPRGLEPVQQQQLGWPWCEGSDGVGRPACADNEGPVPKLTERARGASAQHPAQLAGNAGPESQPRAKTNPGSSQLSPAAPWQLWGQSPNPNPAPHNHKLICPTTSQHERRWSQNTHTHKNSAGKRLQAKLFHDKAGSEREVPAAAILNF